ncbi:MAG: DNA-3-methyladenine glycosylase [Candidatus Thermoplasmatota archaeon]|nr:DNA-3-methyladenine glycosylase [Candidatus Thermoplasmatota archaeon]
MDQALPASFYARETPLVARELLGRHVVHRGEGEVRVARIVETEAYLGPEDPGSHATRGKHTQAGRLWEAPGTAYVYICYGIHDMLNVVAHAPGGIGAVLLRAAEPIEGVETIAAARGQEPSDRLLSGPGRLAQGLGVTRDEHDGVDLTGGPLHLTEGAPTPPEDVAVTGRIGLSQGGSLLLRMVDASSAAVSHPVPAP